MPPIDGSAAYETSDNGRSWDVDQGWLLPPSLHEFVPPGHMAHFVRDTIREALDLAAILDTYAEECGYPPYHPGMIVALLLYGADGVDVIHGCHGRG
ncbi:hypothetical protein QO001_004257 [Methylobacterium brachiatum]|uniref:Transposase n=1 Tax=Methylobacterium brachiatum TaxID=269660 RepID=A0AAJ1TV24_9HYPH|nr:hypothetical protein [Methylobacterium brachiatum]